MKTKHYSRQFLLQAAAAGWLTWVATLPVQADYSSTVMSLNPVGYWRLNEPAGSGTAINLGSALATGNAAYIANPTLQQPGAMGTDPAALFDGTSQYASVPYNAAFNPSGSFTVGFWANKTDSDNTTRGAIFSRDPADSGQNGWLFFASNGDGNWWFRTYTGNTRANAISSSPIVFNQWTYVVGVHDATDTGTNYLYVNGVLAAAPVGNAGYTPNASFPMFFGAWADTSATASPGFYFPGRLDEIAFFDKALTPAQIHDLYVAAEYPPRIVQEPSAPAKIYAGDPVPITLSVVVDNVSATPATYQWTKNSTNLSGATTASLALGVATTNTSGNYAVVVSNPNGSVTSTVVPISVVVSPPGRVDYANRVLSFSPVAYYRLNDAANATTTANAGSWGAGADGAYHPGATGGAAGVPYPGLGAGNYAARFAGIAGQRDGDVGNPLTPGSCIKIPAQSGIVEEMTITCWVKRNGGQLYWRGLVTQRDNDPLALGQGGNGTGLTLGADNAGPDQGAELRMLWNKNDVWWQWSPQLNTPNQQWAFCAVVFSATNRTIYLNTRQASQTVEAAGATMPQTPHDWAVNPIFIGYDARGPYYNENSAFNGTLDEVAIFNRALTSNEMMQLYAAAEVPPIILVQPQAPPPPVYEGMRLSLSVTADASASTSPLAYQWTRNGIPISGQTATNFAINALAMADTANYAVVITNAYGAVTSSIVALTVLSGPPFIAQPPQSIQRYAGSTATFSVVAFGSSPLSYQWYFSTPAATNMIAGATNSSCPISEVGPADAGNYRVLVTNPYGTTNAQATLTVLTATKLAAAVTDLAPLAYWRLDETSGTVAYDYWGGHNGTLRPGVTNNVPGPEPTAFQGFDPGNKAYGLNGNGGYVTVPSFGQINGAMTIVAWIKPEAVQSDFAGLVFTRGDGGDVSGLDYTQGGELGYHWNDAAASYNWRSGVFPTADQWNFVALVVEPTQATLYLDRGFGLESAVNILAHGPSRWSGVRFGSDAAGGRDYRGSLDDVAVYASALPTDEIESIRQAGVNGIYAPAKVSFGSQPQSQTVFVGSDIALAPVVSGSQPISYQWQKNGVNIPGANRRTFSIPDAYYPDAGTYRLLATNSLGGSTSQNATLTVVPFPTFANFTNNLVLHLQFDGNYQDVSGRGNHGTPMGTLPGPTFVAGKIGGNAVQVDSEADTSSSNPVCTNANYVTLGAPVDLEFGTDINFSVAYWVKLPAGTLYSEFPLLCNTMNGTFNPGLYFGTTWNTGGSTWWLGGVGKIYESPANSINDGNWHHLVFTFDRMGDGVTYLDGVKVDSRPINNGGDVSATGQVMNIGQDASGTYPWFGVAGPKAEAVIDDLGIWRRTLSPTEAESIYLVANTYGRTFDTYGPVNLTIQRSGTALELIWQAGTLMQCDTVNGTYTPVAGASAPYYKVAPAATGNKFYKVQL